MAIVPEKKISLKNGTSVLIRTASVSDAERMKYCVTTYIEDNQGQLWSPGEFSPTIQHEETWISGMLNNPSEILLVAEIDGQIIGNIDFHIGSRKRLKHTGEFGMSVLPEFRGKGIGSILLNSLLQWTKNHSEIEKVNLRVLSNNTTAIALYKKYGFLEEGRKKSEVKYEDGSYADDVHMALFV